ncbi:MAG TPA: ISNCY family transposase [Candidatus Babeliales bacterium]|nr:ISNCY family transposase [Candidatus Babeliales bacterium]
MGHKEKKAYLAAIRKRYRKGNKELKTRILDEFCAVCKYHRKYASNLLWQPFRKKRSKTKKRGKRSIYNQSYILEPLTKIWLSTNQMCSKKLKAALPIWLPFYEDEYGQLLEESKNKLLVISASTIDRLLKPNKAKFKRKGLCGTKPGSLLKNQIPIRTDNWDITKPGFCEADTVAHCGNSLSGDFAWSLTLTDIYSAWTENRAIWGKGSQGVLEQIQDIESKLPFQLLGFDCDNGSEFLNHHLIRYFSDRPKAKLVQFSRSRPYHKNDNAHVEQKNWTHVRQLFGYDRFDKKPLIPLMNDLYRKEYSLLQNYFCPTMKLLSKERVNSKYRKKYGIPQTPYQRLLTSDHIHPDAKQKLTRIYESLNPFILRRNIETKLKNIFNLI